MLPILLFGAVVWTAAFIVHPWSKGQTVRQTQKSGLTELFRARDASCPKGKKMGHRKEFNNLELNELFRARYASCPKGKKMEHRKRFENRNLQSIELVSTMIWRNI